MENFSYNCFDKGYPKRIYYKHVTPLKIHYGPKGEIVGFFPRKLEFWKYINSKHEEDNLYNK